MYSQKKTFQRVGGGALLFLFVCLFSGAELAHAAVWRTGDNVSIAEDKVVSADFYGFGSDVHLSGAVEGDVYVAGGTVTLNGPITGDVVVLGGTVLINGPVSDDVRVIGGKVVIGKDVGGDVVVAGGSLSILSTAHVGGDLFFYGGVIDVGGTVKGVLQINAETLTVDGEVGSLSVHATQGLILKENAHVLGTVVYESPSVLSRAPSAEVDGDVSRQETRTSDPTNILGSLLPLWFMALFGALVAVLLLKDTLLTLFSKETHSLGFYGLLGLGALCLTPIASALLIVVWPGMLLGIILLAVYVALAVASFVLAHIFVGALIAKLVVKHYKVTWLWAVVGVCAFEGVLRLPFIGLLVGAVMMALTSGILVSYIYVRART